MGYFFAILGSIAGLIAILAITFAATPEGNILYACIGAIFLLIAAVFWVGAGIIFRMDDYHSKKDTSQ